MKLFNIFSKKPQEKNTSLSVSKKISFKLSDLIKALGDKSNILSTSASHTKIKISVKDKKLINKDLLEKLKGVSGMVISGNNVSLITGNQAKEIERALRKD